MIIACCLFTVILESIMLFILKERKIDIFAFMASLNAFTNLTINSILIILSPDSNIDYYLWVAALEIAVLIVEFLFIYLYTRDKRKSTIYSLCCNLFSYIIGTFVILLMCSWCIYFFVPKACFKNKHLQIFLIGCLLVLGDDS